MSDELVAISRRGQQDCVSTPTEFECQLKGGPLPDSWP